MISLTELRSVIVETLKNRNILTIGERVFSSRTENAWNEEGNFICVYTNNNKFDDGDRNPVVYGVTSEVIIDIVVQDVYETTINGETRILDVADQMDFITQEVLNAVVMDKTDSNIYRNLPFKKIRVDSIQNTLAGNGEFDKGTQRISLVYTWYMELPVFGIPEDEFLIAHTKIVANGGGVMEFDVNTRPED